MKRVIEIDENMYATLVMMRKHDNLGTYYNAIVDSEPLNETLDKISGEIKGIKYLACPQPEEVIKDVLDIINKYKESEGE